MKEREATKGGGSRSNTKGKNESLTESWERHAAIPILSQRLDDSKIKFIKCYVIN
jgi:hypothetical protein